LSGTESNNATPPKRGKTTSTLGRPVAWEESTCHALVRHVRRSFRAEAERLVRTSGKLIREVASDLGVSEQALRNWVRQGDLDAGRRTDGLTSSEREELRQLRRRVRVLEQEREIRKTAAAFFARESDQRRWSFG
jgi:transposase